MRNTRLGLLQDDPPMAHFASVIHARDGRTVAWSRREMNKRIAHIKLPRTNEWTLNFLSGKSPYLAFSLLLPLKIQSLNLWDKSTERLLYLSPSTPCINIHTVHWNYDCLPSIISNSFDFTALIPYTFRLWLLTTLTTLAFSSILPYPAQSKHPQSLHVNTPNFND